jgi:hypothetical protein
MNRKYFSDLSLCVPALVAVLAVSAISGCGGDDDDGNSPNGTTTSSPAANNSTDGGAADADGSNGGETGDGQSSKTAFIKEADAICRRVQSETAQEIDNLLESAKGPSGEAKALSEAAETVLAPHLEEQVRDIQTLDTPPSADGAANAVIVGTEEVIEVAENDPQKFAEGSIRALERLIQNAERQGFAICGPITPR